MSPFGIVGGVQVTIRVVELEAIRLVMLGESSGTVGEGGEGEEGGENSSGFS